MTLRELLASVSPKQRNDAIWLASSLFQLQRSDFLLNPDLELTKAKLQLWKKSWQRRLRGEPLQYIAGKAPFWGRDFSVKPGVLIPRPETERLVELALGLLKDQPQAKVVDVGTGSGIIAATLKLERPELEILATDISPKALRVAEANAVSHKIEIEFRKHDGLEAAPFLRNVFLVVSNPPYLSFKKDKVAKDVLRYEPELALQPGPKTKVAEISDRGAWIAERMLRDCVELRPRYSAFELSPRVAALLERKWRRNSAVERVWREADLAGRKRFLLVAWKNA